MFKKKPSIVLIFPPYSSNISFRTTPPLGINYLATILKKQGFTAKALDFNQIIITTEEILNSNPDKTQDYDFKEIFLMFASLEECLVNENIDDLAKKLYQSTIELTSVLSYDVIGFSVAFAHQMPRAIEIAKLIRSQKPDVKIILGGSQITLLTPEQLNALEKDSLFDFIICGDGEASLPSLLKNMSHQLSLNKIIKAEAIDKKTFAQIPSPEFLNFDEYFNPRFIPILISKGCHWGKCSFCDYKKFSKNLIVKDPENTFKQIAYYNKKLNPEGFVLISDAIPPNWYSKLADIAIKKKVRLKTYGYMLNEKALDESFFESLEKAGVYEMNFGTESLNDRILKLMNKKADYATIKQNLQSAAKFNIVVSVNIIADFPSITFAEAMEVADKLEELQDYIDSLNVQYFDLTYDCDVFNNPEDFAISVNTKHCVLSPHGMHSFSFKRKTPFSPKEFDTIKNRYEAIQNKIKQADKVALKIKKLHIPNI